MAISILADVDWKASHAVALSPRDARGQRIRQALGVSGDRLPSVDEETLGRYYRYLAANLTFPFTAHYPQPSNSREEREFRCRVLGLLDPAEYLGDQFDGIFCHTRKGRYELNLPLIELELPQDSLNFQLIDDFWYWFWNWR